MRLIVLCCVGALLLSGCATTPLPSSQATPAPAERVLAFQEKSPANNASLVLTRDEGFLGSGCYYALWINGKLSARFATGETAVFFIEPGEHVLRAGRDPQGQGLCGVDSDNWTQRETILRANERKFFRLSLDQNGKLDVQRSE